MELSGRSNKSGTTTPASEQLANHHRPALITQTPACQPLSIKEQFAGTSVLITGATGFVGSVVLEQVLRCCPDLKTVYVLCRDKKGDTAEHRIRRLLHSGLFHNVRNKPHLRAKVSVIKGDLKDLYSSHACTTTSTAPPHPKSSQQPEAAAAHSATASACAVNDHCPSPDEAAHADHSSCDQQSGSDSSSVKKEGASDSSSDAVCPSLPPSVDCNGDQQQEEEGEADGMWDAAGKNVRVSSIADLAREPRLLVIHSAARIALEDPLQVTLSHNYFGLKNLMDVLTTLPGICGIVHVSTAFVNCCKPFLPEGSVSERIYPLQFGDREVDHAQLVADLMTLRGDAAEARSAYLQNLWGFPNSYTLGKSLTERLLRDYHHKPAPVCIVRPTLVSALGGPPYPGFSGNLAGPSGYTVAFAMGFFTKNAPSWSPYNHLDNVPADCVSSCILAAAAALLAGVDVTQMECPRSDTCLDSRSHTETDSPPSEQHQAENGCEHAQGTLPPPPLATPESPVAVYHTASTSIQPLCHAESYALAYNFFSKNKPKGALMVGDYVPYMPDYHYVAWKSKLAKKWTHIKVGAAAMALSCFGQEAAARRLRGGYIMWDQTMDPKNDFRLTFSVRNATALEALVAPEERASFPLVWRGEWVPFMCTYMAAVLRLFLKQDVPRTRRGKPQHSFVYIPNTRVV